MSEIKLTYTGGPAFPVSEGTVQFRGLSKREWFAGMALQGILSRDSIQFHKSTTIAVWAYDYADAMVRAGEVQK